MVVMACFPTEGGSRTAHRCCIRPLTKIRWLRRNFSFIQRGETETKTAALRGVTRGNAAHFCKPLDKQRTYTYICST